MSRVAKLGAFRQVRRSSGLGRIALDLASGAVPPTAAGVASRLGTTEDEVVATLRAARRTHGVDHRIADDGRLSIVVPFGVDLFASTGDKR